MAQFFEERVPRISGDDMGRGGISIGEPSFGNSAEHAASHVGGPGARGMVDHDYSKPSLADTPSCSETDDATANDHRVDTVAAIWRQRCRRRGPCWS